MSTAIPEIGKVATTSPIRAKRMNNSYVSIKPLLDFALALVFFLVSAPIILLGVVLVRLSSPALCFICRSD